jgi:hypothetical protein
MHDVRGIHSAISQVTRDSAREQRLLKFGYRAHSGREAALYPHQIVWYQVASIPRTSQPDQAMLGFHRLQTPEQGAEKKRNQRTPQNSFVEGDVGTKPRAGPSFV